MQITEFLEEQERARPSGAHSIKAPSRASLEYAPKDAPGSDSSVADIDGDGTLNVSVGGSNLEGIRGYNRVPDGQDDFTAGVKVEGRDLGSVRFAGNGDGTFSAFVPNAGAYAGETLTLSAAVDGSGYEPDVVESSAVIEGA